jgi:hypothetical protein
VIVYIWAVLKKMAPTAIADEIDFDNILFDLALW